MNVKKMFFCSFWITKIRLLYAMNVWKTSFVTLWMLERCFLLVLNVWKTFFVRYVWLKDTFFTLCMTKRCFLDKKLESYPFKTWELRLRCRLCHLLLGVRWWCWCFNESFEDKSCFITYFKPFDGVRTW